MQVYENDSIYIITPLSPILDKRESSRLLEALNCGINKKIAFDMSHVEECSIDFLNGLKLFANNVQIGLFNISSDVFVLLNYMGFDKYIKLFVSEQDFQSDLRQIVCRRFSIV